VRLRLDCAGKIAVTPAVIIRPIVIELLGYAPAGPQQRHRRYWRSSIPMAPAITHLSALIPLAVAGILDGTWTRAVPADAL
jgi:hypothetical protein